MAAVSPLDLQSADIRAKSAREAALVAFFCSRRCAVQGKRLVDVEVKMGVASDNAASLDLPRMQH